MMLHYGSIYELDKKLVEELVILLEVRNFSIFFGNALTIFNTEGKQQISQWKIYLFVLRK